MTIMWDFFREMDARKQALTNEAARNPTRHSLRMAAMGFTFLPPGPSVEYDHLHGVPMLLGQFRCVCGAIENFRLALNPIHLMQIMNLDELSVYLDPAKRLAQLGSFSEAHLIADGYSPDVVASILQKGRDFDAEYFEDKRRSSMSESELLFDDYQRRQSRR